MRHRIPTEHTMASWDGVELFYRAWVPEVPGKKGLLLFHRRHEHSGRWQEVVEMLGLEDVAIFAWDARGQGRSLGARGSADNFAAMVKDVDAFVGHVSARHAIPVENMMVLAHGAGAVSVAAWVHDYAPRIRALVLAAPAFRVRLYVPFAVPLLRLKGLVMGPSYLKSYVEARMLTHDPEQAASYRRDKLIFRENAENALLDLHDTSTRLLADAGAIQTPTLLLAAGSDWVVSLEAQREFFNGLSSAVKRMHVFPSAYHGIFHEKDRRRVVERVREFIVDRFAQPAVQPSLIDADRSGYTWEECERLGLRLRGGMGFAAVRAVMKTVGRLSKGIRLGWRHGFDSGVMLDYVYKNHPQGLTRLGRAIDYAYLNSVGWRGIRQRKVSLEALLRSAIEETHAAGRPVRILDIACGGGRYVLETMGSLRQIPMSARLHDDKAENLDAALQLARRSGLEDIAVQQADAFDRASLARLDPRPTVGVASGVYELFSSNGMVLNSLLGLSDAIEPGGYLIYTNQPWQPQLEFIARVLRNREGKPWIMRRRTQAEMDQLVLAAGFEKVAMAIDRWGMFTVSLARRMSV